MNNGKSYLMGSGLMDDTLIFVRAMSWGMTDAGYDARSEQLPMGSHQMIYLDENELGGDISYTGFAGLGDGHVSNVTDNSGYLATFINPTFSGFEIRERIKYDTFGSAAAASGFLSKLQEQPPNTLLVLSTHGEPSGNKSIFQTELEQSWGAEHIGDLDSGSSYILVASKERDKIYETYSSGGTGPVGFCGWINKIPYRTGLVYAAWDGTYYSGIVPLDFVQMGLPDTTGVTGDVYYASGAAAPSNITHHYGGFFKSTKAGTYLFRLRCDNLGMLWLGPEASANSGDSENFQSETVVWNNWYGGYKTGIVELESNTFYPFRFVWGEEAGAQFLDLDFKYENENYQSLSPYLYHSDYWVGTSTIYGNAPTLISGINFDIDVSSTAQLQTDFKISANIPVSVDGALDIERAYGVNAEFEILVNLEAELPYGNSVFENFVSAPWNVFSNETVSGFDAEDNGVGSMITTELQEGGASMAVQIGDEINISYTASTSIGSSTYVEVDIIDNPTSNNGVTNEGPLAFGNGSVNHTLTINSNKSSVSFVVRHINGSESVHSLANFSFTKA